MYLDRSDISFRKEDESDLSVKDNLTVFRPGNRTYPEHRGYVPGEVVKARIIDVPGDDKEKKAPVFSKTVQLVKIQAINVLNKNDLNQQDFEASLTHIKTKEELEAYFNYIYHKVPETITKIDIKKITNIDLVDNDGEVRGLFSDGTLRFATLPEDNVKDLDELLSASYFSLTFINHDYAGITPKMWNYISKYYNLDIKNTMVITQPQNFEKIIEVLHKNKKYLGGGLGVGFKDFGWDTIKHKNYGFINPVADEMQSVNFLAHFGKELHGYNSDASGYVDSLCDKFKELGSDIQKKNIVLLGAGGTSRGIALELVNRGINTVTILNRTIEKAEYIASHLNSVKPGVAKFGIEDDIRSLVDQKIDAIINLSTKGADGDFVDYSGLITTAGGVEKNISDTRHLLSLFMKQNPNIIISDINLTKTGTTPLLEEAKALSLPVLDGKLMVVYQGAQAIWTVFGDKIIAVGGDKSEVQKKLLTLIFGDKVVK